MTLVEMTGIGKEFPGVRALDDVELSVEAGEVHCLLGQNGAGKSTLIKVLAGAHRPDTGEIRIDGEPVRLPTPTAAIRHGIATLYQELDLVDGLSVAENVFLGHEQARGGFVRRATMRAEARRIMDRLGHREIRVDREVGTLSAAGKQIVSLARALSLDARLIVLDEPSAVLAADEVANLFRVIRGLTARGVAVLYISHRLAEIREIGDRVSVLKDGRTVAAGLPARTTPTGDLVARMTGRRVEFPFPPRPERGAHDGKPEILGVTGLTLTGAFEDVTFSLREGEILGLAGLVGSGRSEVLETVYGARKATAGEIRLAGKPLPDGVGAAVRGGLGLAPEERKSQALLLHESVARNVSLPSLRRYARFGWFSAKAETDSVRKHTEALDLRPADVRRVVGKLSGGNQQKAVVARWLLKGCRVLLLDEPTRGVDVGARAELYRVIRGLADSGVAILLVSSELPEVLGLADRVLVLREGHVVTEADARELDERRVLDLILEEHVHD
ncbi:sugar ABC transporter ATP-binding protein [Amycolatopsis sp. cmx-4-68]|uniref:sugar ABC transporter ATP-binding protein n=1 Tax=Amycolatopsis sp. cmx-4-68 TaxID=2790938 RepID=UPI003978B10D